MGIGYPDYKLTGTEPYRHRPLSGRIGMAERGRQVHAVFGAKNPHPNYIVGGMPCSIDLNEATAINADRLALVKQKLEEAKTFSIKVSLIY